MNGTLETIPISALRVSKPAGFDKAKVEQLAESIRTDGLLQNPLVRPLSGSAPFTHEVVYGRKRVYAAGKILGWTEIECKVGELDDESADSAECAENLFRTALSDEDQKKALIRWYAVYHKRNPNANGKGSKKKNEAAAAKAATVSDCSVKPVKVKKVTTDTTTETTTETTETVAEAPKPFSRVLKDALGISQASADRLARVAKNLTEEQITVLAQHKATNEQTDKIAALGKGEAIDQAIKLIGSGMNADEAVRQAAKLKAEKAPKAAPAKAGAKPAAAPKPKELTDDEWLATYCATIINNLKHKVAFKADAIMYRRVAESLTRFRTSVKKAVDEAKSPAGHNGAFYANIYRIIKASHPQHWLVCGKCEGTGKDKTPGKEKEVCTACFGAAYKMKLED